MKRFLRYVLYREGYRKLRTALRNADSSDDSDSVGANGSSLRAAGRPPHGLESIEGGEDLKVALQGMDPYEFEHFVADLWERLGWETEVSDESVDEGVDVVAAKSVPYDQTTLIQAKRYGSNTTVGSPAIQQYASLEDQYPGIDAVAVVTTNEFTGQAADLAERLNVKLIDGDDLVGLIAEADAVDLVAEYLAFVSFEADSSDADGSPPVDVEAAGGESSGEAAEPSSATRSTADPVAFPSTTWHRVVGAATVGWAVVFLGVELLPMALWGPLFFASWLALPIGIYMDAAEIPDRAGWPGDTRAYVLGSLVWLFAVIPGVVYLWQRRRKSA